MTRTRRLSAALLAALLVPQLTAEPGAAAVRPVADGVTRLFCPVDEVPAKPPKTTVITQLLDAGYLEEVERVVLFAILEPEDEIEVGRRGRMKVTVDLERDGVSIQLARFNGRQNREEGFTEAWLTLEGPLLPGDLLTWTVRFRRYPAMGDQCLWLELAAVDAAVLESEE